MKKDKMVSKLRKADGNVDKFISLATQVIDLEVESDPENKKVISMFTARDMAFGAQVSRNKHIAIGVVVGVVIFTALTYALTILGIDTNLQFVFSGIIILIAVTLDSLKYVQKT